MKIITTDESSIDCRKIDNKKSLVGFIYEETPYVLVTTNYMNWEAIPITNLHLSILAINTKLKEDGHLDSVCSKLLAKNIQPILFDSWIELSKWYLKFYKKI